MSKKNKDYFIKPIRVPATDMRKYQATMDEQGIPNFGAFAKMAFTNLVRSFEDEKKYQQHDYPAMIDAWEKIIAQATQPIDPRRVAEDSKDYRKK